MLSFIRNNLALRQQNQQILSELKDINRKLNGHGGGHGTNGVSKPKPRTRKIDMEAAIYLALESGEAMNRNKIKTAIGRIMERRVPMGSVSAFLSTMVRDKKITRVRRGVYRKN